MKAFINLLSALVLVAFGLTAQAKDNDMGFFDIFLEPHISFGAGNYNMGSGADLLDDGSYGQFSAGGKVGIKLGPVFLGFDYLEGEPGSTSDRVVSASNRERFPLMDSGRNTALGPVIGIKMGPFYLWGSSYAEDLEQDLITPEEYIHEYSGTGYRAALSLDIYKHVHASVFYHSTTYDRYSSSLSTDLAISADLGRDVQVETYGIMFSYFFPLSKLDKFADSF